MTDNDRQKFDEIMISCFSIFREEPKKNTVDLYFRLLSEYSIESISQAFTFVLKTSKFFPKPADIVEYIEGNAKQRAEMAFDMVWGALPHIGSWNSSRFSDPVAMETVRKMGGIRLLCECELTEKKDKYFEFVRIYQVLETQYKKGELKIPDHFVGEGEYKGQRYDLINWSYSGICSESQCLLEAKQKFGYEPKKQICESRMDSVLSVVEKRLQEV